MSSEKPIHNYSEGASEGKKYADCRDLGIKDIAKLIRSQLIKEFPTCNFSVSIERYSMGQSMTVALMTAPFQVVEARQEFEEFKATGYAQLNHYQLISEGFQAERICNGVKLTTEAWLVMKRAVEVTQQYNYDDSDSRTDYFSCNFHLHLAIGKWNKPFQVK